MDGKGGASIKNKTFPVILCIVALCVTAALNVIPDVQASTTVTIPANADSSIWSEYPTNNYGATSVWVLTSKEPPIYSRRALFNFDLVTIPGGVTITSATLNLYFYNAPHINRQYSAHRITSAWVESTVTWDTAPSFDLTATSTITTGTTDDVWLSWDVTADVVNGYSNPSSWHGILVKDHTESYSSVTWTIYSLIASKEHPTAAWHPYLEVTYTEQIAPTIETAVFDSPSSWVATDTFNVGDDVCVIGWDFLPETDYDVQIVNDVDWTDGMTIPAYVAKTTVTTDDMGEIPDAYPVWNDATAGKYDIIVDVNGNTKYDEGVDALDDSDIHVTAGFFVIPEVAIGSIMAAAAMFAALGLYTYKKKHTPK